MEDKQLINYGITWILIISYHCWHCTYNPNSKNVLIQEYSDLSDRQQVIMTGYESCILWGLIHLKAKTAKAHHFIKCDCKKEFTEPVQEQYVKLLQITASCLSFWIEVAQCVHFSRWRRACATDGWMHLLYFLLLFCCHSPWLFHWIGQVDFSAVQTSKTRIRTARHWVYWAMSHYKWVMFIVWGSSHCVFVCCEYKPSSSRDNSPNAAAVDGNMLKPILLR